MALSDPSDPSELSTDQMIRAIYTSVKKMETRLEEQQTKIVKLEEEVSTLNKQVYQLQNLVNQNEQEKKSLAVRVTGFPMSDEEKASTDPRFLAKKLHEKLLVPIFNHAKSKNIISRIPAVDNVISSCFRIGNASSSSPPIILKFAKDNVRLIILNNKRLGMPTPSPEEKTSGITRYNIVEDLTAQAYKTFQLLQKEETVEKIWTAGGKIFFCTRGDKKIHTVKSVYDPVTSILANVKN